MAWVPQPIIDPHFGYPRGPQLSHDELVSSGEDMSLTSTEIHMSLVSQSPDLSSEMSSSEEEEDSLLTLQQQLTATSLETSDLVQSRELVDIPEKVSKHSPTKGKDSFHNKEKDLTHSRVTEHSQSQEKDLAKSKEPETLHSLETDTSRNQKTSSEDTGISHSQEGSLSPGRKAALVQSGESIASDFQVVNISSSKEARLPNSQETNLSLSQEQYVSHIKESDLSQEKGKVSSHSQETEEPFSQEKDSLVGRRVTASSFIPRVTTNLLLISKTQTPSSPPPNDHLRGFFLPVR